MKALVAALVLMAGTQAANAGMANAIINCQSKSGLTTVKGEYPVDSSESSLQVQINGQLVSNYVNSDLVENLRLNGQSVDQVQPGAETIEIINRRGRNDISMLATVDVGEKFDITRVLLNSKGPIARKSLSYGGEQLTFDATLTGVDIGSAFGKDDATVNVRCTYIYQI